MTFFRSKWTLAALALLFVILGLWGGADNSLDRAIVGGLALVRVDSPVLTQIAVGLAFAGSAYVTLGGGIALSLLLMILGRRRTGLLLLAGILLERVALDSFKLLVARGRPAFDEHPVLVHSFSYPSGHSANTMAAFTMIALAFAPARLRKPAVIVAVAAAILIGLSRPYLGVHWASDVLGGWALGLIAIWLFLLAGERSGALPLEQQHQIVGGHGSATGEAKAVR